MSFRLEAGGVINHRKWVEGRFAFQAKAQYTMYRSCCWKVIQLDWNIASQKCTRWSWTVNGNWHYALVIWRVSSGGPLMQKCHLTHPRPSLSVTSPKEPPWLRWIRWGVLAWAPMVLSLPIHIVMASLIVWLKPTGGKLCEGRALSHVASPSLWFLERRTVMILSPDHRVSLAPKSINIC